MVIVLRHGALQILTFIFHSIPPLIFVDTELVKLSDSIGVV